MDADQAPGRIANASEKFGREIRVFTIPAASEPSSASSSRKVAEEEPGDDFYEFTADDYYRIVSTKIKDQFLKTRKIREAESAARRARINKAVIRVKFPDNYVLEATFHPSETIQSLNDLLIKVIARPDLPFYLYTTPPKQRINDPSVDLYSAGFVPGAVVYFSLDLPEGSEEGRSGPFLREDVRSLEAESAGEKVEAAAPPPLPQGEERRELGPAAEETPSPAEKKTVKPKPKWFKM